MLPINAKRPIAAVPNGGASASRWGGIKSQQPQEPILGPGSYRVQFAGAEVTFNKGSGHETFKSHVTVQDIADGSTNAVGSAASVLNIINGKSQDIGQGRVKAMFVALAGLQTDEEFDALDARGASIEATLNGAGMVGRLVDVTVTDNGTRTAKNAPIYEYTFTPTEGQEVFAF